MRRLPLVGKLAETFAQTYSLRYIENVRLQLAAVSASMCAAKWLQSTVHLEIGETHSCHHPVRHRIPLDELALTPQALHDTLHKKRERKKMLNGERPAECSYCWEIEDAPGSPLSDRHYKSAEDWARPRIPELARMRGDEFVDPTYLELSFSSNCQLKCSYCSPSVSSALRAEINKFGPYPTGDKFGEYKTDHAVAAPYQAAFWQWWPELSEKLLVFRVTGGEPLLEEDTFRVMDSFLTTPRPELKFSLNSNLMISEERFARFRHSLDRLQNKNALKEFHLYASIDTWGEDAEWIRHGLKVETFSRRLEEMLKNNPEVQVTLMVTFSALSIFRFKQLMDYVVWCRQTHPRATLRMGVSLLHYPHFMALDILPKSCAHYLEDILVHHRANSMQVRGASGFSAAEIARFERIVAWWKERPVAKTQWSELQAFVTEHDRRKGSDFSKAFPRFWQELV